MSNTELLEELKTYRMLATTRLELVQRYEGMLEQQAVKLAAREATIKRMDIKIQNLTAQNQTLAGLANKSQLKQRDDGSIMSQLNIAFKQHRTAVKWNDELKCIMKLTEKGWVEV